MAQSKKLLVNADRLRDLMHAEKINAKQLSEQTGIAQSALSRMLSGSEQFGVTAMTVRAFSKRFGIGVEDEELYRVHETG